MPEDPAAPSGGRTIGLRVVLMPAAGEALPDPIVLLAGGPGQAASEAFIPVLGRLDGLTRDRDVVLVDQRGTGESRALRCSPPDPTLAQLLDPTFDPDLLTGCLAELDADPTLYTTPLAADDLDAVRAALGYAQLNLIGGSYGTRAALVYARRHPTRVRSMVIDGVAPVDMALPLGFAADGQRALDRLFADCEADPECRGAYPGLSERFDVLLSSFEPAREVTVRHPRTGEPTVVKMTRDTVALGVRGLLYAPSLTAMLPRAVTSAQAGDLSPLVAAMTSFADGVDETMSHGMFLSVVCAEDIPRITDDAVREQTSNTFLGSAIVDVMRQACEQWPTGKVPADYAEPVAVDIPTLVLSGDLDPVTPPRWGEHVVGHLPGGRHVVVPGAGHGTITVGCMPDLLATFVESADPGGLDTSCLDELHRPPFFIDFAGPPT